MDVAIGSVSGLVAGVQLCRGSRDDLALCPGPSGVMGSGPNTSSRIRRHASVVLLRRSLAETGGVNEVNSSLSQPSLAVWNSSNDGNFSTFRTDYTLLVFQDPGFQYVRNVPHEDKSPVENGLK